VKTQPRQRLGPDVRDEGIALACETEDGIAARLALEVDRDALLVAVGVEEARAHAAVAGTAGEARVVAAQRLDLEDLGAEIAQQLSGERPHQHAGQVEYAHAVQRSSHPVPFPETQVRIQPEFSYLQSYS